jgi:hypothetical protein
MIALLPILVAQLDPGGMAAQGPAPDQLTQLIPGVGGFLTGGGITGAALYTLLRSYVARIEALEKANTAMTSELVSLKATTEAHLLVLKASIEGLQRLLERVGRS